MLRKNFIFMVDLMCEECYYKGDKNEFQLHNLTARNVFVNMPSARNVEHLIIRATITE